HGRISRGDYGKGSGAVIVRRLAQRGSTRFAANAAEKRHNRMHATAAGGGRQPGIRGFESAVPLAVAAARPSRIVADCARPALRASFMSKHEIQIRGARTHNLKNIDLDLPRDNLIVLTGLSGSGKSSLAF